MTMKTIEEYQNLVSILTQALEFYADEHNYTGNSESFSKIGLDGGSQARFALEKIQEFDNMSQNMQEEYNRIAQGLENGLYSENDSEFIKNIENNFKNSGLFNHENQI